MVPRRTGHQLALMQAVLQDAVHLPQKRIACLHAKPLIEPLEVADVQTDDGISFLRMFTKQACPRHLKRQVVFPACERVGKGDSLYLF